LQEEAAPEKPEGVNLFQPSFSSLARGEGEENSARVGQTWPPKDEWFAVLPPASHCHYYTKEGGAAATKNGSTPPRESLSGLAGRRLFAHPRVQYRPSSP